MHKRQTSHALKLKSKGRRKPHIITHGKQKSEEVTRTEAKPSPDSGRDGMMQGFEETMVRAISTGVRAVYYTRASCIHLSQDVKARDSGPLIKSWKSRGELPPA